MGDWSPARVQPGKIVLRELGGIGTGLRQLLRQRPLEVERVEVRGKPLTVPTAPGWHDWDPATLLLRRVAQEML